MRGGRRDLVRLDKGRPWTIFGESRCITKRSWSQSRAPCRSSWAEWGACLNWGSRRDSILKEGRASTGSAGDGFSRDESILLSGRSLADGTAPFFRAIRIDGCRADSTNVMRAIPWLFRGAFARRILGVFVHDIREGSTKGVEGVAVGGLSSGRLG